MDKKFVNEVNEQILQFEKTKFKDLDVDKQNKLLIENVINDNLPILNNLTLSTYEDLVHLEKASSNISVSISQIKEEVELADFLRKNKNFDEVKLRRKYEENNIKKKFPSFDLEKYLELINNPFLKVKTFHSGEVAKFNPFIVKKLLIAINQMIFDEMDLYILNIGREGSAKSTLSSQQILFLYIFLKEVGLVKYPYEITKMFFSDIKSFLKEHEEQKNDDYFRIEVLDEGNELNRANFREEDNQQFKYEMRTERKMLRIIIVNMQQIGELDTSLSLSRINFIFDCQMKNDKRTGTLKKGFGDFYVIPRGDYIFSEKYGKYFSRLEILNAFAKKLDKKKDYYTGLPKDFVITNFSFEKVWGFDKDVYDDYIKDSMRKRKFDKGMKITLEQAFAFVHMFRSLKDANNIKVGDNKKMYDVLFKFHKKHEKYFDLKPEITNSLRRHYGVVEGEDE